jgi:bloom syndrome protein
MLGKKIVAAYRFELNGIGVESKFVANARSQLNKQIQQLEKYINSSNLEEERQKSNFATSMAPPTSFVYETPQRNVISSGPNRYDGQAYMGNDTYEPSYQSSYFMPSGPVEREPFIPKIIEVNYIEGSGDKRWSSRDFSWTKELEVFKLNYCQLPVYTTIIVISIFSFDSFRLIIREYLEITHFAPTKER